MTRGRFLVCAARVAAAGVTSLLGLEAGQAGATSTLSFVASRAGTVLELTRQFYRVELHPRLRQLVVGVGSLRHPLHYRINGRLVLLPASVARAKRGDVISWRVAL